MPISFSFLSLGKHHWFYHNIWAHDTLGTVVSDAFYKKHQFYI